MTQESESLITDEMRASIGREGPPTVYEIEKLGIRQYARAVGHIDPVFYDEDYAKSKGHRSLVAPPRYLGQAPIRSATYGGPGAQMQQGGRRWRALDGGSEHRYTGVEICAGDVLTSVTRTTDIKQREGRLGPMLITTSETVYTNQNGEVVCRVIGTGIQY